MSKDKTQGLDQVLERLDRIETALQRLVAAVEGGATMAPSSVAPVAAATAAVAVAKPDKLAPAPSASSPAADPAPAPAPVAGTIDGLLQAMFVAAMLPEAEETFEALEPLTHPAELQAPRALDNLRAFSWKKLRNSVGRYLTSTEPTSFDIVRTSPKTVDERVDRVKVFLRSGTASPSPVTLVRDERSQGAWRIKQISL